MDILVNYTKRKGVSIMSNVWKAIRFVFSLDKKRFIVNYGIFTLQSLSFVISLWALQVLLAKINLFVNGEIVQITMIGYLIFFILLKILIYLLRAFMGYYCEYYEVILNKKVEESIQNKSIAPIYFENKDFLDLLSQAQIGKNSIITITNAYIDIFFMYGLNFIFLSIYLFRMNKVLSLILILVLVVQMVHHKFERGIEMKLEEAVKNLRRKKDYYIQLFSTRESAKEIYALGSQRFLLAKLQEILQNLYSSSRLFTKKILFNDGRVNLLKVPIFVLAFVILYRQRNALDIAQYSVLFITINSIFTLMEEGFYTRLKSVNHNLPKLAAYFTLLETDFGAAELSFSDEISLKNVSFRYPNAQNNALKNINLNIQKGEKVAVVGMNGSGKSTLSKLILQVYEASEGKVSTMQSSAVFQDFVKYELSTMDNIRISDFTKVVDQAKILDIEFGGDRNLDLDKILSKRFSDEDISQGQWQKIAILRGLHKDSEFLVFDEPTWAIDPVVEKKVFDFIYKEVKIGMLVVTHRLSLIKKMDRIIVLDKGELVGYDTHDNLIKNCDIYKMLWEANV